jgi:D-inositol-3-phosphate glycosyltransferase
MRRFTEEAGAEYDVVHSHYWLSGLAAMRYRATQPRPSPFVHMFHTLSRVKEFYLGESDPGDSALRPDGERCVLGHADVVVGSTESERDEITRLYGRAPARFVTIPPGVDLARFRPRDKAVSRRLLGIDAKRVVLFAGRLDNLKGLDLLLHAVAGLPARLRRDLRVVLIGGADPRDRSRGQRLRRTVQRLEIDDLVDARGLVNQDQLSLYYTAADVCTVPSAYESFGMVAVEAMACQTPVVAFRVGGLATTIKDGRTGFLAAPGSAESFTSRLTDALLSPDLDAMGRQARISVQRYSWERVAKRTLELYEDLVAGYATGELHYGHPASAGH